MPVEQRGQVVAVDLGQPGHTGRSPKCQGARGEIPRAYSANFVEEPGRRVAGEPVCPGQGAPVGGELRQVAGVVGPPNVR